MQPFRATPGVKAQGEDLFNCLDHDAIIAEIHDTVEELPPWAWTTIGEMVYSCAEKYLARDISWMEIASLEERFDWNGESGIYDLRGRFTDAAPDQLRGKSFVRDWKTAKTLDARWVERYSNGWQWRIYLYNSGADIFVFTGIDREGKTRDIYLTRPPNLEEQVRSQIIALNAQREGLTQIGAQVFPLNQPHACTAFGRECEYREDCTLWSMPKQSVVQWNWSPSAIDAFQLCAERFRRDRLRKLDGQESIGGESAQLGLAFHRGIAEVYRQAWGFDKTGVKPTTEDVALEDVE